MSTGHIKLWWSVKKQPDSFNIYHSLVPFSPTNLPVPVATGLDATAREFRHLDQEHQYDHYYRIASVKNGRLYVSKGVLVRKKPTVPTVPYVEIRNRKLGDSWNPLGFNGIAIINGEQFTLGDGRSTNNGVTYFSTSNGTVYFQPSEPGVTYDVLLKFTQDEWQYNGEMLQGDGIVDEVNHTIQFKLLST